MRPIVSGTTLVWMMVATCVSLGEDAASLTRGPRPGDVFRMHHWVPSSKWQRVTGPEVEEPRAREFLPNAINEIEIRDLDHAIRAEVNIQMLLCHAGTVGKKIRLNEGPWIEIPPSPWIPGDRGRGGPAEMYQSMRYVDLAIPLSAIREGRNTFEFTCEGGPTGLGRWWPQWIVYGATFRIYYDPAKKAHPRGRVKLLSHEARGPRMLIEMADDSPAPARIDLIGRYRDFNWRGDGAILAWQYRYLRGAIHNHLGTAPADSHTVAPEAPWIPDPGGPIPVVAQIIDETGLCTWTTPTEIPWERDYSVRMYLPHDIPKAWSTRDDDTQGCEIAIADSLEGATAARLVFSTWNGVAADRIAVNGQRVAGAIGKDHELSYDAVDVPLDVIQRGENTVTTYSDTEHHGIEVLWPSPVLFVRIE